MSSKGVRFTLLQMEAGEAYVSDVIVFHTPSQHTPHHPLPRSSGRLRICSRSLIFEPDLHELPILRVPFKAITTIEPVRGGRDHVFRVLTTELVSLFNFSKPGPYKIHKGLQEHTFTTQHSSLHTILPLLMPLLSSAQLPPGSAEEAAQQLMSAREEHMHFDLSSLQDGLLEKIRCQARACVHAPLVEVAGVACVTTRRLYFQSFSSILDTQVVSLRLDAIQRLRKRRYGLRQVGLELYLSEGSSDFSCLAPVHLEVEGYGSKRSILLSFATVATRDMVWKALRVLLGEQKNADSNGAGENKASAAAAKTRQDEIEESGDAEDDAKEELQRLTAAWVQGQMSNFDYLMEINFLADRSFNDLSQYPVYPWVIADYWALTLDLEDPKVYRDLSKPIGALDEKRLQSLVERYREMPEPKFLYGTHYSTPGYVLYYLLRKAPELTLHLQRGKFDTPDRCFSSLPACFRSVLSNPADVKELIPDFYAGDGKFLENYQKLDLGERQDGSAIGDVILPLWANDAQHLVKTMREALESEHVSRNLHNWIDLIFGYKQTGEEAAKADNVFHPMTYQGNTEWESLADDLERKAVREQVQEFGQCPKQLFFAPHPAKHSVLSPQDIPAQPSSSAETKREDERESASVSASNSDMQNGGEGASNGAGEKEEEVERRGAGSAREKKEDGVWGERWTRLEARAGKLACKDRVSAIAVCGGGKRALAACHDASLRVVNLEDMSQVRCFTIGELALSSVQVLGDAATTMEGQGAVVVGSWDNSLSVFELAYGRIQDRIEAAHDDAVSSLALRNNRLVSGAWDCTVKLWDCSPSGIGKIPVAHLGEHEREVVAVSLGQEGSLAASLSADGAVLLHDLRAPNPLALPRPMAASSIQVLPSEKHLVVGLESGEIALYDISDMDRGAIATIQVQRALKLTCVDSDGRQWVAGDESGALHFGAWGGQDGDDWIPSVGSSVRAHSDHVTACSVSMGGKQLVSGSHDKMVAAWNFHT